ncbi:probable pectinesterase 55 [Impatiens glandulifera]|uniref:probable pectinesterase 55 n=1 Tax=Impatiens glandulifera TaxID=253017 RepID=UPI001FB0C347|nr:probable pectinesterase 55 [Impatiens glandulifera]
MNYNSWLLIATIVALSFFLGSSLTNNFSSTVIVDKSGKGQFTTIQDAINSVPSRNNKWFHIVVKPGVYNEKVTIKSTKEYIFLEGSGYSQTTISWDDHQTYRFTPTFGLFANNFVAKDISFMNSYNINQKSNIKRALAATIYGDRVAFYNCGFYGVQNTLYDSGGRHYYNSCYIEGAIDFIWGNGLSLFESCKINATAGNLNVPGSITAQGRQSKQYTNAFVFTKGHVVGTGQVFLGRAFAPFSRVIFSEMTFSSVVHPLGWDAGNFRGKEKYFTNVEAGCKGPGSNTSKRATWTKIEKPNSVYLQQFTVKKFIDQDGWLANTRFDEKAHI